MQRPYHNLSHIYLPGHVEIPTCSRTGCVVTVPSTSRILSPLDDRTAERRDDSDWVLIFLIALYDKNFKNPELDIRSKEYASNDYTNLRTNELFKFKFSNPFWSLYSIN